MIILLEKKYKDNNIAKNIIKHYKNAKVLEIDNYKNIFDKNIFWGIEKTLIIAWVNNAIIEAPDSYWYEWKWFFIKNSLNCIYNCKYCYLKWSFKNNINVIFVNYNDIKKQIIDITNKYKNEKLYFYSSDYSDNLAIDNLTSFTSEFIPFFWKFSNDVNLEIRTKSVNINNLYNLSVTENTEISFSLNPNSVISEYEDKTPSLDLRVKAINKLIKDWWKVGIRFVPLLEVANYKEIYLDFLLLLKSNIDFNNINSFFIGWLLYTNNDYNKLLIKEPNFDILYKLSHDNNWFYKSDLNVRQWFYMKFQEIIWRKCYKCFD